MFAQVFKIKFYERGENMELFKVFIKISMKDSEFRQGLAKVKEALKKFNELCKTVSEETGSVFKRVGDTYKTTMKWLENLYKKGASYLLIVKLWGKKTGEGATKVSLLGKSFTKLKTKLLKIMGPKGWIIAAIGAIVAAVVIWVKNNEEAQEKLRAVWEKVQKFIGAAVEFIQDIVGRVFAWIQDFMYEHGERIREFLSTAWETIKNVIGTVVEVVGDIVERVFGWVQGFIDEHGETIMAIFSKVWNAIKTVVETVTGVVQSIVERVFGGIRDFIDNHGETITSIFSTVWNAIKTVFDTVIGNIQSALRIFTAIFQGDWQAAWDEVKEIGSRFMESIENILSGIVDIGKNLIHGLWEGIQSMRTWINDKVSGFFDGLLGGVKRFLRISSPSRVFADEVGKMIVKGIAKGIDDEAYLAEESAIKMAKDMLEPQIEMFELSFLEISRIVIAKLQEMSRKAIQVIRAMTAKMDAILNHDGFRIGRNFFRSLGDGLIAEEAALLSRARWVADAIRAAFADPFGNPAWSAVNAAQTWGSHHSAAFKEMASMPMATSNVNITQNFYGVKEKETAYQAYRATQRVAWGVER